MKKTYQCPEIKVIDIVPAAECILAGSNKGTGNAYARPYGGYFDEEESEE